MSALLDTSIIVRYLTDDPKGSSRRAALVIDGGEPLSIPEVVLAEAAFVLRSLYRVPRDRVVDELIRLLRKENISPLFLEKSLTLEALLLCRPSGRVSFPDGLTWAAAHSSGNRTVYTLDQRFPSAGLDVRGLG